MLIKTVYSTMVLTVAFAACTICTTQIPAICNKRVQGCSLPYSTTGRTCTRPGRIRAVATTCLKELYLRCSRESSKSLLGFGEASWCSFGHEALLNNEFGGDFNALLAWWQVHRDDPIGKYPLDHPKLYL